MELRSQNDIEIYVTKVVKGGNHIILNGEAVLYRTIMTKYIESDSFRG